MIVEKTYFSDRLINKILEKKSYIVAGLDPVYQKIPLSIRCTPTGENNNLFNCIGNTIFNFNKIIIDTIHHLVAAFKPQIAFYEMYGLEGLRAFIETVQYAKKKNLIVIEDAKRNDIGTTAQAYSNAHIGKVQLDEYNAKPVFDVDALTVNPFLGSDGILPFLKNVKLYKKGIFILVKTSNQSSYELQDLTLNDGKKKVFTHLAELVNIWGENYIGEHGYSSVGAVVGATFPEHALILRKIMPYTLFLVPGYGAQGAIGEDIINCFNKDGIGAIIGASRTINYPHGSNLMISESEFTKQVYNAVQAMNNDINTSLSKNKLLPW